MVKPPPTLFGKFQPNESDEKDCKIIILKDSYKKDVAPIGYAGPSDRTVVPAYVTVTIALKQVTSIEESTHSIELQFEAVLQWKDARVTFLNLKHEITLNRLSSK